MEEIAMIDGLSVIKRSPEAILEAVKKIETQKRRLIIIRQKEDKSQDEEADLGEREGGHDGGGS